MSEETQQPSEMTYGDMGITDTVGIPMPNWYATDMPLAVETIPISEAPGKIFQTLMHGRTIGQYDKALAHFRGVLEGAEVFSPELKAQLQSLGAEAYENRLDKEKSEATWKKIEAVFKDIKPRRIKK